MGPVGVQDRTSGDDVRPGTRWLLIASLWVYLTMLAAVVLTGAYGWWAARRPAPQQDSPSGVAPAATSGT